MPEPSPTLIQVSNHPPSMSVPRTPDVPDTRAAHPLPNTSPPGPGGPGHPPSLVRQAWNLARSLADFVADGCKTVTRPSSVPTRSDTILVTSTEYNDAGQAFKTIDPAGREDRQELDDAGRIVRRPHKTYEVPTGMDVHSQWVC